MLANLLGMASPSGLISADTQTLLKKRRSQLMSSLINPSRWVSRKSSQSKNTGPRDHRRIFSQCRSVECTLPFWTRPHLHPTGTGAQDIRDNPIRRPDSPVCSSAATAACYSEPVFTCLISRYSGISEKELLKNLAQIN